MPGVDAALRARIQRLRATGVLPHDPPATMIKIDPWRPPQAFLETGPVQGPLCAICLKPAPALETVLPDGRCIRIHEACRSVWATT